MLKVFPFYYFLLPVLFISSSAFILGNISSPVITRLGVNQPWYKHWYSDTMFSKLLNQDKSIETFIIWYLSFGIDFKINPLLSSYWYLRQSKSTNLKFTTYNMRFFRRYFYSNDIVGVEHSYFIRNHTGEYFPFRVWVMRYGGWIILVVTWFKPRKRSIQRFIWNNIQYRPGGTFYLGELKSTRGSSRLKLLLFFFLKRLSRASNYYVF